MTFRMRVIFQHCLGILLVCLGSCAYRLGPTNGERAGARSVQVNPFENRTIEPRLVEAVTLALRLPPGHPPRLVELAPIGLPTDGQSA